MIITRRQIGRNLRMLSRSFGMAVEREEEEVELPVVVVVLVVGL